MKRNKMILDERILSSKEKINSEAFCIVIALLIISTLVKSLILDMPFKSYICESAICIISLIYVVLRNISLGNIFSSPRIKGEFITSLITGVVASSVISIINYVKYGGIPKWIFVCFAIMFMLFFSATFILLFIANRLSKSSADKTFKKYND